MPALVIAALFGGLVAGARWRELTGGSESLREREPVHAAGAPAPERTGGRTEVNPTVRCPDCCTPQPPPAGGARDDARKTPEEVEERR